MTMAELEHVLRNRRGGDVSPAPYLFICKDEHGTEYLLCRDSFFHAQNRLKVFNELNMDSLTLVKDHATREDMERLERK